MSDKFIGSREQLILALRLPERDEGRKSFSLIGLRGRPGTSGKQRRHHLDDQGVYRRKILAGWCAMESRSVVSTTADYRAASWVECRSVS
jgi:hypothetical protein